MNYARPLTNLELQHAIAAEIAWPFGIGESHIDEHFLPTIEFSSTCAGLTTVDEETGIYTASICVGYLSSPVFENGPCVTEEEVKARLESNPLYDYAARFWGHHARTASTVQRKLMQFLVSRINQNFPKKISGPHLATYFGTHRPVNDIVENRKSHELRDSCSRAPLLIASENGRELVADLLLVDGADIEVENNDQQTALHLSTKGSREGVVQLLLNHGANFDARDGTGMTPLHWAAHNPRWADLTTIAKLFLDKGVVIEAQDGDGATHFWRLSMFPE
ncbi:unnamed protein product [Clonostachys rhizophaga]|uniref:Uncharacterized protein n=1 Tax=Clonostachys rhizophaga TaxID=160324 RepID=A0A9N9YML6_9HYPO|nr:unnamed protein product [Clonostachys rhizophaga]